MKIINIDKEIMSLSTDFDNYNKEPNIIIDKGNELKEDLLIILNNKDSFKMKVLKIVNKKQYNKEQYIEKSDYLEKMVDYINYLITVLEKSRELRKELSDIKHYIHMKYITTKSFPTSNQLRFLKDIELYTTVLESNEQVFKLYIDNLNEHIKLLEKQQEILEFKAFVVIIK